MSALEIGFFICVGVMAKSRYVKDSMRSDNWFIDLDVPEKLLFTYLLTNDKVGLCGVYELSLKKIGWETGIDMATITKALKAFESLWKVCYRNWWIMIANFLKNQSMNDNMVKGAKREAESISNEIWLSFADFKAFESIWKAFESFGILNFTLLNLTLLKPNGNFVIEKTEEKPKIPKKKREWPTRQQKQTVIETIKNKVEAYWMVYNPEQDKDFAGHILSKKMTEIAAKYWYMTPLAFLLSVVDMSMQETGGRLDKRWRFKVNGPKVLYQKYAEICADYQNSTSAANSGDVKQF